MPSTRRNGYSLSVTNERPEQCADRRGREPLGRERQHAPTLRQTAAVRPTGRTVGDYRNHAVEDICQHARRMTISGTGLRLAGRNVLEDTIIGERQPRHRHQELCLRARLPSALVGERLILPKRAFRHGLLERRDRTEVHPDIKPCRPQKETINAVLDIV